MNGVQSLIAKLKKIFRPENAEKKEEKANLKKDSYAPQPEYNEKMIREAEYYQDRMTSSFNYALYNPHFF